MINAKALQFPYSWVFICRWIFPNPKNQQFTDKKFHLKSYKLFLNKNCLAESSFFPSCYTFSNYNAENFCLKWLLVLFFSNPANLIYETILVFTWQNSKYTIRTRRHKNTVVVAEYYFQYNKNEYDKLTLTRNSVTTNLKPTPLWACQTEPHLLPGILALPLI